MATLAVTCRSGGVLGIVTPLALAAAAGTALVVDLDADGPRYPGDSSLAELVRQGPRLADLRPTRDGIAVLRNGGITAAAAHEVVVALVAGWPCTVLRMPPDAEGISGPIVPVVPLLPGGMTPVSDRPAAYQQMGWHEDAPGPGVTLPTPSRRAVGALLEGRMPLWSRWIAAWTRVWEAPWV
ncbi:MAG: hypothetical protein QNL12_00555 [Acidimicrobiia bacterium]|nr:hypothetical protein [Acidimicrobiia bacterium]MDX2465776.1 hypothetical protein [Acidimicrobiia bacterium]